MRALQPNHIVDIYVWVAETLPDEAKPKGGRPLCIRDSELLTLFIWNSLTNTCSKTLKQLYDWIYMYHTQDIKAVPTYGAFVVQCHRVIPKLLLLVSMTLESTTKVRFCDSTMLPVCKQARVKEHKVAKGFANWGFNHQGPHFGFKLHAAIDAQNRLVAIVFTPAGRYDGQLLDKLVNSYTKYAVGDSHYGGGVERKKLWQQYHVIVVAYPHHKQKRKVTAGWQQFLMHMRPKIEATFDQLKEHRHLVSSFPRSVEGYFLHYLRVILGYQVSLGF